jgi:hypothetical protein
MIEHNGAHKRKTPCCKDEAIRYLRGTLNGGLALWGEFLTAYNNGYAAGFKDKQFDLSGGALNKDSIYKVLKWRNCWQPNEADDLLIALTQGVDKVSND